MTGDGSTMRVSGLTLASLAGTALAIVVLFATGRDWAAIAYLATGAAMVISWIAAVREAQHGGDVAARIGLVCAGVATASFALTLYWFS